MGVLDQQDREQRDTTGLERVNENTQDCLRREGGWQQTWRLSAPTPAGHRQPSGRPDCNAG